MPLRQENLSKLKQTFPEKNGGYKSSGLSGGSIVLVKQAGRQADKILIVHTKLLKFNI